MFGSIMFEGLSLETEVLIEWTDFTDLRLLVWDIDLLDFTDLFFFCSFEWETGVL